MVHPHDQPAALCEFGQVLRLAGHLSGRGGVECLPPGSAGLFFSKTIGGFMFFFRLAARHGFVLGFSRMGLVEHALGDVLCAAGRGCTNQVCLESLETPYEARTPDLFRAMTPFRRVVETAGASCFKPRPPQNSGFRVVFPLRPHRCNFKQTHTHTHTHTHLGVSSFEG